MNKILFCLILITVVGCSKSAESRLDNCEAFELGTYQHPRLKNNFYVPKDWYIELDLNWSDTVSLTAYDTLSTGKPRSIGFLYYPSEYSIKEGLEKVASQLRASEEITLMSSGEIEVEDLTVPYFFVKEAADETISTLIIYYKHDNSVVNIIFRELGEFSDINSFCWSSNLINKNASAL